jgi:signal transduction histidine kinase
MRPPGLRPRLLGALVLVPVVSLGVGAAVLLPTLKDNLHESSVQSLLGTTEESRAAFREAELPDGGIDPGQLVHAGDKLAQRSGAHVIVLDQAGRRQYESRPAAAPDAAHADVAAAVARRGEASARIEGDTAVAVVPLSRPGWTVTTVTPLGQVDSIVADVWEALGLASVVGLAAAAFMAGLLSRSLLRRLIALRDAVRQFEATGTGHELPADPQRDELGELARSFAAMSKRVQRQETARRRFVATASHELRTPVASLRATLELLESELSDPDPPSTDALHERIEGARAQAARLGLLADELLQLSRIDAGVEARREPVELGDLAHAVLGEFRDRSERAGTPIELDVPPGEHWVLGDPGGLARVLRILVDNALRFAPPGTAIRIRVRAGTIEVADDGPGIPPDERDAIFERFTRGRNDGGGAGFGLGLALGRELMRRMQGDLVLDPQAPVGARFRVLLEPAEPWAPDHRRAQQDRIGQAAQG